MLSRQAHKRASSAKWPLVPKRHSKGQSALACMQHEVKLLMLVRCRVQVITAYDNVRLQPDTLIQIIADKVSKA